MNALKNQWGVPENKRSCHTAKVNGYFVEGHVPASDIKKLIKQNPNAKGIAVPGMPLGSPGMEVPNGTKQPFNVELVEKSGKTKVFSVHK